MTLKQQIDYHLNRAKIMRDVGACRGPMELVLHQYSDGSPAHTSIVGSSISSAMIELWESWPGHFITRLGSL